MIYAMGHGRPTFISDQSALRMKSLQGSFRFYEKSLPTVTHDNTMKSLLSDLGAAMTDPANFPNNPDSNLAAVFTYFGQFIDHDVSAGTDFDADIARLSNRMFLDQPGLSTDDLKPRNRDEVEIGVLNQNTAKLDLDSVYGDVIIETDFDKKFSAALRHTSKEFAGKMRIDFPSLVSSADGNQVVSPPKDGAGDILRIGRLVSNGSITQKDLEALPDDLKKVFFEGDELNLARAAIGDARNDENLFVAQFHLAIIRLHNRIVDSCDDSNVIEGGTDALFEWAKTRTRWIYQWLVANVYLKGVCDPKILQTVISDQAKVYSDFLEKSGGAIGGRLPLPLEYSVGAFRFGHSMARQAYEWNEFFTHTSNGSGIFDGLLDLLFKFTGGAKNRLITNDDPRLPSNWVADWNRLAVGGADIPGTRTKAIDTNLSEILGQLPKKSGDPEKAPNQNLAILNLFKGHLLNLPSAQNLVHHFNQKFGYSLTLLSQGQLESGPIGHALKGTRLVEETPLWYYILREAELSGGNHLGDLGSLIVASTLLGLIISDDSSYWHQSGSHYGKWHPKDCNVKGVVVDNLPEMFKAALFL